MKRLIQFSIKVYANNLYQLSCSFSDLTGTQLPHFSMHAIKKSPFSGRFFWRATRDFLKCSAFDALRLPSRSARTAPYSDVHRTSELHARALTGSSPSLSLCTPSKNLPFEGDFSGAPQGTRTPNLRIRSARLYPIELVALIIRTPRSSEMIRQ